MEESGKSLFLELSEKFAGFVWGYPAQETFGGLFPNGLGVSFMVVLLFGAGLYFTLYFGLPQLRFFWHAVQVARGKYDDPNDPGEITHFQALCAALSATIGLGNIAGVAVAISSGGPGAIFWMWVAGGLGMATKFTSISLALFNREVKEDGTTHGGPMFTIKNGISNKGIWKFASGFYAACIILSCLGAGNMFQANSVAKFLENADNQLNIAISLPDWVTGIIFSVLAGLVLIGGIKRIGNVAAKLVPAMVVIYLVGGLGIVLYNFEKIPSLLGMIFSDAFTGTAAVGGFAGVAVKEVIVQGVRRAVFSNEAGMGSAAIAHSAAKSNPIMEGVVGLLGPFIDTIMVCTLTALTILATDVWTMEGAKGLGAGLTGLAFESLYGSFGAYVILLVIICFAFSTMISWSYYGEQGVMYLFGKKGIMPFRFVFIIFIMIGSIEKLETVLNFSDAVFALLAFPTLASNIYLAKKLKVAAGKYYADLKAGKLEVKH
jgi:AGCS family alanine or glycine:cation symporter